MTKVHNIMNKGSKSNQSHINDLPIHIIQDILMKLSLQEAVKTSVLSSNWRYAWNGLTELVFDDSFCEKSILNTKSTLTMAIYQVLLLHHGPLYNFSLCLSNLDGSCSAIDQFLLVALKKGVKDLTIDIGESEPYSLPSSIFKYSQQLEYLDLSSCVFETPSQFNGFSKLETLELEEVHICGNKLSSLISNCPLLTSLSFSSTVSTGSLDIVAPNLEDLSIESRGMPICFKNTPKLAEVVIISCEIEYTEALSEEVSESGLFFLSGRLPVVENLTLDDDYLECYHLMSSTSPNALVTDVSRVKTLTLSYICFGVPDEFISVLGLIRSITNLEKLTIDVTLCVREADHVELIEPEGFSDFTLGYLKEFELLEASGIEGELQFIKLILAKSPALKKFLIELDSELSCEKKLKIWKELTRFRRASPVAEIAYEALDWYSSSL